MAETVRAAAVLRLAVVAQVHTHPKSAYHSESDIKGTNIRYSGFASIVLPDYGDALPALDRADVLILTGEGDWKPLAVDDVTIIGEHAK